MISRDSLRQLLAYAVNKEQPQNLVLRLFVNDITPQEFHDASSYVEAEGSGYSPVVLRGDDWTIEEMAKHKGHTFRFTSALGDVFGYYLTREKSRALVSAGRFFDGPYNVAQVGDKIQVVPFLSTERLLNDNA